MKKLVIIHGWSYTIEPWEKTVQILRQNGVEVQQLKVPGLTAKSDQIWTVEKYVQWLKEQLDGRQDVAVLGHSNGGRIAMHYLATYPNAFRQLILLNSAGVDYQPKTKSLKNKTVSSLAKIAKPLAKVPFIRKISYRLIGSDYGRAPENMKKTLTNMLDSDKTFQPSTVQVPKISLLWGKKDKITPIEMGRIIKNQLPSATMREFDEWQHAPYITRPEELAAAILEEL